MRCANTIRSRAIGRSGVSVTELGFGAASLGNLGRRITDEEAHRAVSDALAAGIGLFDTAPFYGRGLSERRLGDALRGRTGAGLLVSTKVGRLLAPDAGAGWEDEARDGFLSPMPFRVDYDYSGDGIMRSFEASLHRLGLDHVDYLFVHDIGRRIHAEAHDRYWDQLTRGGGFDALVALREQGAIRGFGLGVNEVEVCIDAIHAAPLDILLLANGYTLLDQTPLDALFPLCTREGIAVIAGAPYSSGILATGTRGPVAPQYDYGPAPADIIARVRRIEAVAEAWQVPLAAAALRFPLMQPCVAGVLPGIGDARRLEQTLALYRTPIPAGFWDVVVAEGLLRADSLPLLAAVADLPGEMKR